MAKNTKCINRLSNLPRLDSAPSSQCIQKEILFLLKRIAFMRRFKQQKFTNPPYKVRLVIRPRQIFNSQKVSIAIKEGLHSSSIILHIHIRCY